MTSGAYEAQHALTIYLDVLEDIRSDYSLAIAELQSRLSRYHYRRSPTYLTLREAVTERVAADAAHRCRRASEQYVARAECSSALRALLDVDAPMMVAALIGAHGARETQALINTIIAESIRKPVLVVSNP